MFCCNPTSWCSLSYNARWTTKNFCKTHSRGPPLGLDRRYIMNEDVGPLKWNLFRDLGGGYICVICVKIDRTWVPLWNMSVFTSLIESNAVPRVQDECIQPEGRWQVIRTPSATGCKNFFMLWFRLKNYWMLVECVWLTMRSFCMLSTPHKTDFCCWKEKCGWRLSQDRLDKESRVSSHTRWSAVVLASQH